MTQALGTPVLPRLALVARDIKLAHSVFALPFAVWAAVLARDVNNTWLRFAGQLALVVACMVAARTFAMVVNRLADRDFDAANPRTARRAFAAGALRVRDGVAVLLVTGLLFWALAAVFGLAFGNWWPAMLALPVLAWISLYSFTKRFTWLCHVFLGGALAASPLAAGLAVSPEAVLESSTLWWLAGMVALWVAGFDVIYALADLDFDRQAGLNSMPARFGATGACWISRALHMGAVACLVLAWKSDGRLGLLTGASIVVVAGLLVLEHVVLARKGKAGLDMAFFTINGIVSCVLGAAGAVDAVL